jgi:hypothetical protein
MSIFMDLHHEKGRVKPVHNYSADENSTSLVSRLILINLLLLDILLDVIEEGLHPLSEDQQLVADQTMRSVRRLVEFPDLKSCVMTSAKQIIIFAQSQHPISIFFSLLALQLSFSLEIPNSDCFVFRIADQSSRFAIEDNCRNIIFMSRNGRMFPGNFIGILP